MSDALKSLGLEALERDRMKDLRAAEVAVTLQSTHRGGAHLAAFAHDIRDAGVELTRARSAEVALVAEVKRLREALTNIRDIEEYVAGRVCTCSGVGCVHCIARLTLEGREGELFS